VSLLRRIELRDPIAALDETLLVVPWTWASWCAYQDRRAQDVETAQRGMAVSRVVEPEDVEPLLTRWPALVSKIDDELAVAASVRGEMSAAPLTARVAWAQRDDVRAACASAKRALWAVELGHVHAVLETPDADVFDATRARIREASAARKGTVASCESAVRDAVLWCSTPLADLLEQTPAAFTSLLEAWTSAGGADAQVKSDFV
jgi:hypothetical protein